GASVWEYSNYNGWSNFGWVSFYDFFEQINVLDDFKFKQYKKLIKSNCFNAYEYENFVFAIQPPVKINRDVEGRLHSVSQNAVEFADHSDYYFIHGVALKAELWNKVHDKKYTFQDFLQEENEEIKSAVLSFMEELHGSDYLFMFISENLTELDTYTDKKDEQYLKGTHGGMNIGVYTLFKGSVNGIDLAFVRCYCPSTDRMFFLAVSAENNNAKDAIASLYRVPKFLSQEIKYIQRQGERFSTVFTENGKQLLENAAKEQIEELVPISGDKYFSLMRYEY
ncbi:MAG: hypothetical protein IT271_12450, partial [Chitinophagales bacterium]|nr:hypothetical protein [Chitinophagales bacterium]